MMQSQQQLEKQKDVALLEQRHAAVVASMRSELDVALERAAKAEQQHREDLQQQQQFVRLHDAGTLDAQRADIESREEIKLLHNRLQIVNDEYKVLQAQLAHCLQQESAVKFELEQMKSNRDIEQSSKKTFDCASFVLQASYRHLITAASSVEYFALQVGLSYDQSPQ